MNTNEINQYIKDNQNLSYQGLVEALLAKGVVISGNAVRHRYRSMGLPHKDPTQKTVVIAEPADPIKAFVAFLAVGRNEKKLAEKFGADWKKLIDADYEGYDLFKDRNQFNEMTYILLPKPPKKIRIQPRKWKFHIGVGNDGEEQPYLLANLPDFQGKITVVPLFDIHYGNSAHKPEKLAQYVNWVKNNPHVYAILGGDLVENAIDRGMMWDSSVQPHSQLDDICEILSPIAHKILFSLSGNHEARTYRMTGIDSARIIAEKLEVPYFAGPVWCSLVANGYKWTIYAQHGTGNSQTKGGKMNSANRPKKFTGLVHFFLQGHVHDRVAESETCIVEDSGNARLVYMQQWTVIAPSFLGWHNTYAYRAGYPPPAHGGVTIELRDNGEYRASHTT